jgi:hypothetical protein
MPGTAQRGLRDDVVALVILRQLVRLCVHGFIVTFECRLAHLGGFVEYRVFCRFRHSGSRLSIHAGGLAVKWRARGTAQVMAEQCAKLLELSEHPSVLIHILPSSLGASPGLGGSVSLASVTGEPDVLLTGSMLEDVVTTDAQQVRAASGTFERVRGRAANTDGSRTILGEAMERWTA